MYSLNPQLNFTVKGVCVCGCHIKEVFQTLCKAFPARCTVCWIVLAERLHFYETLNFLLDVHVGLETENEIMLMDKLHQNLNFF